VQGGKPFAPPEGQRVVVTLYTIEAKDASGAALPAGQSFHASLDRTANAFTVGGPDGYGVPPGKYRVSIFQGLTRDAERKANEEGKLRVRRGEAITRDTDMLKDLFGPNTSPIVRQIREAGELVVDLDAEMPRAKKDAAGRAKQQQRRGDD
jgi:hypothetical protein